MSYKQLRKKTASIPRRIWIVLAILVFLGLSGTLVARHIYNQGLGPVNSSQQTQIFTVEKGSTVKQIAADLEEAKLIRSAWAFQLYIHSKSLNGKLQAGTYALSPSQDVGRIVEIMTQGRVATRLVTILPGRRIDQVRADLINSGFEPAAVDAALEPEKYVDMPVLAFKPAGVETLEGLLWPDSFQKDDATTPETIIRQSLAAMGEQLTADVQAAFAGQGLTVYRGLVLSSIVLQEVNRPADQAQAAQVFLTRLKKGMSLDSDASVKYGAVADGHAPSLIYDSAYNLYKRQDLPPTPISTVNSTSLYAAGHPAGTDWLYFVSGDDGTTHFSRTIEEHEALTKKYCTDLCGN